MITGANENEVAQENDWVRRAKAGELEAFEQLTRRYERPVFSLALRILRHPHDAEDVTQETFISALENLPNFREESRFSTWLFKIASHAALKILRKRRGIISLDAAVDPGPEALPHPEYIADWRDTPERLAQRQEIRDLIEQALEKLDEKHRIVFLLRDSQGLSVRETAQILGLTEANVKVRLLRARLQMREHLTRQLGDPERRLTPAHRRGAG